MLSYEDRRRLAAIEQQLMIDDPALARRLANHRSAAQVSRRVFVLVLGSVCVLATSVGFLPADVLLVFLAAAPAAVAGYFIIRRAWRHRG
jgi:4-hydroxybenzoate polyprenyltransferase